MVAQWYKRRPVYVTLLICYIRLLKLVFCKCKFILIKELYVKYSSFLPSLLFAKFSRVLYLQFEFATAHMQYFSIDPVYGKKKINAKKLKMLQTGSR